MKTTEPAARRKVQNLPTRYGAGSMCGPWRVSNSALIARRLTLVGDSDSRLS
jgi:hypothetical protein